MSRLGEVKTRVAAGTVLGLIMLTAMAQALGSNPVASGGPLETDHNETISGVYVADHLSTVSIGTAVIENPTDAPITIEAVESVAESPGVELVGVVLVPFPDDWDTGHLVGVERQFPPSLPSTEVERAVLPAGEGVQIVFGLRLAKGHEEGSFGGVAITYSVGDSRFRTVRPNGGQLILEALPENGLQGV